MNNFIKKIIVIKGALLRNRSDVQSYLQSLNTFCCCGCCCHGSTIIFYFDKQSRKVRDETLPTNSEMLKQIN